MRIIQAFYNVLFIILLNLTRSLAQDRLCGLPNDDFSKSIFRDGVEACEWQSYGKSLGIYVIPAAFFLCLSILAIILVTILLCLPVYRGYARPKVGVLMVISLAIGLSIIGTVLIVVGSLRTTANFNNFDRIDDAFTDVFDLIDEVEKNVTSLDLKDLSKTFLKRLGSIEASFRGVHNTSQLIVDYVYEYDGIRNAALLSLSACLILFPFIALTLFLCQCPKAIGALGWFCVFFTIVLWASFIVHIASRRVIKDSCREIKLSSETEDDVLNQLMECNEPDGILGQLKVELKETVDTHVNDGCDKVNLQCQQVYMDCKEYQCSSSESLVIADQLYISYGPDYMTVRECSTKCRNPFVRRGAMDVIEEFDTFIPYIHVFHDMIPMLDCSIALNAMEDVQKTICTRLPDTFVMVLVGHVFMTVALILTAIISLYVFKGTKMIQEDESIEIESE